MGSGMADGTNELLNSLSPADYAVLRPHLTRVNLEQHTVQQQPETPIEHVHFPLQGMISLLASSSPGQEVEIAAIGREGAIGTKIGLHPQLSFSTAIVQLPGIALRMSLADFQKLSTDNLAITHIATCANDVLIANLQQAAACNALHTAEQRLARWLLHAQDKYGGDDLPLTQDFLAQMLAVRRTTVTVTAGALERQGLVKAGRGHITITNRGGLEKMACSCHAVLRDNIDAILATAVLAKKFGAHP
jgi:CRP-like cAMP-binding protein